MKAFGIALIVVGVLLLLFNGFNIQTKKKVIDIGPIEVNKKVNKHVEWSPVIGGTAVIAGIILVVADRKKR